MEFQVGDRVFFSVKSIMRFDLKGKLSPRFIRPFEILAKVGSLEYKVILPPSPEGVRNMFHLSYG